MRKVILQVAVSLDGYIEGPNGEYDWCFTDQDYGMSDFYKRIDSMFIGRKSYELLLTMDDADMPGLPELTTYVFSTTLTDVKPGVILISEETEAAVKQIKSGPGKDIWLFGGADLTASLLSLGLIDEIILAVHPILLGAGKPLAGNLKNRIPLTLADTKTYSSGLVMLTYTLDQKCRL
ncbi:dihydrofolate reductase family protein [Nibrella viscosa]|uniref:Dihydrofolate reductase family protein n=1 Tax=Nibrella viscosa TaxID=1084524 RepID=A0ABP8KN43_9BACT